MTWQAVPLGTVAEIQLGKMLSGKASKGLSPAPYLRNANVQWGRVILDDLLEMDFSQSEREKFSLKQGDLIVCEGGEPGRCAVVTEPLHDIYFQKALMRVRPQPERLTPQFLQRFMQHAASRGVFRQGGNQSTIAHFPAVRLRALAVPLPPLPEQKRIAAILDAADALRAKRRESIEQLDSLIQATFLEMFGDPVTNPKGWDVKRLSEVCRSISDIDHKMPKSVAKGYPFISAKDLLDDGTISFKGVKQISEEDFTRLARKGRPEKGDIIYSRIGTVGKARLVDVEFNFLASYSCCTIKPKTELVDRHYLCHLMDSPFMLRQAQRGIRAIAVPDLGMAEIKNFKVILPPMTEQHQYASIVESIEQQKARMKAHLTELDTLFASLQSRAFNGELVA